MSSSFYNNNDFESSPQDEFNKISEGFGSTMKWAVAGSVVSGVVMTVAIVAIVYAIIDCLKKAGTAIPTYARIATGDSTDKVSNPIHSSHHVAIPIADAIQSSEAKFTTIERFIGNMEREKPIRFSPQELAEVTENNSTILGSGGFGVVFKGLLPNGAEVAVKVLTSTSNKQVEEQFMAEMSTIGRANHINVVRLYGFCFHPEMSALVYEFMENGALDMFLFDQNQRLETGKLHEIAIGVAKGISYLHEECQQRIIHYDIKPGNVLLDKNLNPKVADFGLAKLCNRESSELLMTGGKGTPGYAAPEMWEPYPVTHKCDVYSFGMLLFEIVGRRRHHDINLCESRQWLPRWIWEMFENNELGVMVSLFGVEEKDREKAERMSKVALLCVQYSPDARPNMSTVVKMLEGGMEIPRPQNPFEHLESSRPASASHNGSDKDYSTMNTKLSEGSSAKTRNRAFEIELASC